MSSKTHSVATLGGLFAVVAGLAILTCCGGGNSSTTTTTGSPSVTLSPTTLSFSSGIGVASAPQSVTVTNSGNATLTFSGITVSNGVFSQTNNCGTSLGAGSNCSISVTFTPTALDPPSSPASGTLSIADNASGSPQTVSLSGTSTSASVSPTSLTFSGGTPGSPSAAQPVTLTNAGTSALTISTIALSGTNSSDFALASGANVCPYGGGNVAAGASCIVYVTFKPPASGTFTATLTVTDNSGGVTGSTQTVALTGSTSVSNTAQVTVGFGPNGQSGGYYDGIFTSVTLCEPGTSTCVTVPNVLVDTGSVGLRVLSSALTGVTLSQLNDGTGNNLNECTQYGDGSFNWGPVSSATVQIGGETASQVPASLGGTANSGIPVQVITADPVPTNVQASGQCVPSTNTPDEDSVATLGANGILGIGNFNDDCGVACTTQAGIAQITDPYWLCTSAGVCQQSTVPEQYQAFNPVAAFSSADANGVLLQLPDIPAAGQATATGTLTFGIGTQSNNALSGTVYELDGSGDFASATYNGVTYTSTNSFGSFIDSGSNAYFVSDATTLNTTNCSAADFYFCPATTLNLSLGLTGSNGTSTTVTLPIANAQTLFSNPTFAAFNNLGGASCIATTSSPCNTSTDSWDLGLPFFFNRTVFVGIAGTNATYPNGFWAF